MSAFPNLSPAPEGQDVNDAPPVRNASGNPRPPRFATSPGTGLVAGAAPPNATPPLDAGESKEVMDLTDEQFRRELLAENNTVPGLVLGVCGGAGLLIAAGNGFIQAGVVGAAGMSFVAVLLFLFAVVVGTIAAGILGKLFASDFESLGGLLARVGAVCAGYFLCFMGLASVMDTVFVFVLGLPILLVLAVWLLGMQPVQAFIFALAMNAIVVFAMSVVAVSLIAAIGPAPVS
jgi:hypothetical protein